MRERLRSAPERRRAVAVALAVAAAWACLAAPVASAAPPAPAGGSVVVDLVPGDQGSETPTGGGPDLGLIVAVIGGVILGAALVAGAGYLVLRRRARLPLDSGTTPGAAEGGEWWTCRNCGRNNIVGSARCYACGTWQG